MQKKLSQRQIPTLLGVIVLAIALVVGVIFLPQGFEAFLPRAAPETTPKSLKITNVRDTGFSVSFVTDAATSGFIKYGTDTNNLRLQAADDRDQTTGQVGQFTTHHITVRDLTPETTYYFIAGTGTTPKFDDNGNPFVVKTAKKGGSPSSAKTIYGNIVDGASAPVSGAIVYVSLSGASELSTISKDSGSWAIPLSTARTTDGSQYITVNKTDPVNISVLGPTAGSSATSTLMVETAQPAPPITLVAGGANAAAGAQTSTTPTPVTSVAPVIQAELPTPTPSASVQQTMADQAASMTVVDVDAVAPPIVTTSQPTISGSAAPNSTISIVVNSETTITGQVQSGADGSYTFDIAQYAKDQHLEAGQHTVTITYYDPTTKANKTVTQTFFVNTDGTTSSTAESANLLALASPTPTPYGTTNPYTIPSPTPTPTVTPTATPSATPRPTATPAPTMPATSSALPQSGSSSATAGLLIAGGFLILAGSWHLLRIQAHSVDNTSIDS